MINRPDKLLVHGSGVWLDFGYIHSFISSWPCCSQGFSWAQTYHGLLKARPKVLFKASLTRYADGDLGSTIMGSYTN
jgi:hypothetical protein